MDRWITDWDRGEPDWLPYYTRANAGETLPDPASPLNWTFVWEKGFVPGWVRGMEEMGIYREGQFPLQKPAQLGMFAGYFYINLSHIRLMLMRLGVPAESVDLAFVGRRSDVPPYVPHPRDDDPELAGRAAATVGAIFGRTGWPEVDERLAAAAGRRRNRPDLRALRDADLVGYARTFLPLLEDDWLWHVWTSLAASLGPGALATVAAEVGRPELGLDLVAGIGDLESSSPSDALWPISRAIRASAELTALFDGGTKTVLDAVAAPSSPDAQRLAGVLDAFLTEHGLRGRNEWDIHSPSWETDPAQVIELLDSLRSADDREDPRRRMEQQKQRREQAAATIRAALAGNDAASAQFEAAMTSAALCVAAREKTKLLCVTDLSEVRIAFLELGRRGVAAGLYRSPSDVMMLLADELDDYVADPARFGPVIADRLEVYRSLFDIEPPFVLAGEIPPLADWPRRSSTTSADLVPADEGTVLSGLGGSSGSYTGPARVIEDLSQLDRLEYGDVLVAPFTDAAWTPLFLVAGAVVVDLGAINSHAMVVARELGIPCVVSVDRASRRIPDGAIVAVDGAGGTVRIESVPAELT
jgi:phosphohistidine swiveling domain-containing protein